MGSILHSPQSVFPCCENSKCTCTHMYTPGRVAHKVRSGQVLMEHCHLGAAESSSATDEQKAGLKSKLQSVSHYLKDTLDMPTQVAHRA